MLLGHRPTVTTRAQRVLVSFSCAAGYPALDNDLNPSSVNKIDLPAADPEQVRTVERCHRSECWRDSLSFCQGCIGIEEILEQIVESSSTGVESPLQP